MNVSTPTRASILVLTANLSLANCEKDASPGETRESSSTDPTSEAEQTSMAAGDAAETASNANSEANSEATTHDSGVTGQDESSSSSAADSTDSTDSTGDSETSEGDSSGDTQTTSPTSDTMDSESETSAETSTASNSEESGDMSDLDELGECRISGAGIHANDMYRGTVDYLLLADQGNGEELCRVRFDLVTVAQPETPCDICYWSTVVETQNPQVLTDIDDRCAQSERMLGATEIADQVGRRVAIGFAEEATGHGEVLVELDEATNTWHEVSFGVWDPAEGSIEYDRLEGFCRY